ncbi:amphi-Trp domain-containing protein [bacterium]|nr:amphi-Trp domain-containing protein [bacterium]
MQANNNEFKHESYQDSSTIVDYLKSIIEGIEKGIISMGNDKAKIDLEPQGLLKMKIEAKRKSSGSKLSLQVSWKENSKSKSNFEDSLSIT